MQTHGHFVEGKPGSPSLIVLHEYWGLNDHIKDVANRFAAEGFTVLAPDLYGGKRAKDADEAMAMMTALDRKKAVAAIGSARDALISRDPKTKVGVTGFCMGGALCFEAAAAHPFAACVPFYGIGPGFDASKITAKVMGHFASHDDWCTPSRVDALETKMKSATFHRYVAHHAFFNDTRPEAYSAPDAKLAWTRTIAFLKGALA